MFWRTNNYKPKKGLWRLTPAEESAIFSHRAGFIDARVVHRSMTRKAKWVPAVLFERRYEVHQEENHDGILEKVLPQAQAPKVKTWTAKVYTVGDLADLAFVALKVHSWAETNSKLSIARSSARVCELTASRRLTRNSRGELAAFSSGAVLLTVVARAKRSGDTVAKVYLKRVFRHRRRTWKVSRFYLEDTQHVAVVCDAAREWAREQDYIDLYT